MTFHNIPFAEGEAHLDWMELTRAIAKGHNRPKAQVEDTFIYRGTDTLLSRAAWIDGMGLAVKSATVFPGNRDHGKPMIGGRGQLVLGHGWLSRSRHRLSPDHQMEDGG